MRGLIIPLATISMFACSAISTSHASNTFLNTVNVVDEDSVGIESVALRIKDDETTEWIGDTNSLGLLFLKPPLDCSIAKRILARPKNPLEFETPGYQGCKQAIHFKVRRWKKQIDNIAVHLPEKRIVQNLLYNADDAVRRDDHGSAALVFTELSARFQGLSPSIATAFRDAAYIRAGQALKVDHPVSYHPDGSLRLSPEFKKTLIEFQREKGLKKTGQLDGAALSAIANQSYADFLFFRSGGGAVGGPEYPGSGEDPDTSFGSGFTQAELIRSIGTLKAQSQRSFTENEFGIASSLYTELAARLRMSSEKQSEKQAVEAEMQAYQAAGKYFGVPQPVVYDPIQGKSVMSQQLVQEIRLLQARKNIPVNGLLDNKTLRIMSGSPRNID